MRILFFVTLLLVVSVSAYCGSAGSAITEFGLIGTWSNDCGRREPQPGLTRIEFRAPLVGGPTETWGRLVREITEAERITDEKLKITVVVNGIQIREVYEKIGGKFRLFSTDSDSPEMKIKNQMGFIWVKSDNGVFKNTGLTVPLLEKCLN